MRTEARFPEIPERAGHYESFYLKLTSPGAGWAAGSATPSTSAPASSSTCALWFVLFDADAAGPRATKRQFGPDELDGAARLPTSGSRTPPSRDGRAVGRVATDVLEARWDLNFSDTHEPFHHLPRDFLYRAPLPKTKFLSPYPDAVFNGLLEVGGRERSRSTAGEG